MSSLNSYREIDLKIDFRRYWLALKRRSAVATSIFISMIALTSIYIIFKKPIFQSSGSLLIKPQNSSLLTGLETLPKAELKSLGKLSDPLITEIEVIRSYPVLQKTAKTLSANGFDISILDLQNKIEIEPLPGTDILTISYQASNPQFAAAVVSTLIDVYIETNIKNNRAEVSAAKKFIESQLPKTAAAVREAEKKLRSFKEQNQIVTLAEESSQNIQAVAKLESLIAEAEAELALINTQLVGLNESEIILGNISGLDKLNLAPSVREVAQKLGEIQRQLVAERNRYHDRHPFVVSLEQEEAELKAKVHQSQLAYTKVQRQSLERKIAKLSELHTTQKAKTKIYPQLEQTNQELDRNLSAAQVTYESLLNNLQKVRVIENQTIANAQIVSPAQVPEKPVETYRQLVLIGGLILASLTALATAFVADLFDHSVKDIQQTTNLLNYPLVGIIPYFNSSKNKKILPGSETVSKLKPGRVFTLENPLHTSMIRAYNWLQVNLNSLSLNKSSQVIAVTSSVSNEGKSEVSANLATAFVRSGQRVLLVDANRYKPTQNYIWGLTNVPGLSEVLEGQADLQSVLQEVLPNLFLLPSGNLSTRAVIAVESSNIKEESPIIERFLKELIDKEAKNYDVIIFDTPSIMETLNTSSIGQIADRMLLVVRPGIVDTSSIKFTKQIFSHFNRQNLGIIVNAIDNNDPDRFSSVQSTDEKIKTIPSLYYQTTET